MVCRFLVPVGEEESRGGDDGLGSLEGREIGLGFSQSLALASLATLMAMAGSGRRSDQSDSGQDDDSSAQDIDPN